MRETRLPILLFGDEHKSRQLLLALLIPDENLYDVFIEFSPCIFPDTLNSYAQAISNLQCQSSDPDPEPPRLQCGIDQNLTRGLHHAMPLR